ncbi:uncharacterized protein KY384_002154 [Bacidia gigantensis]|uniref:uncharacterized protein n=1 Tax=Bacidia gigantensis TaxID=2732470 RepID=UPI001D0483A7|nr:uncharacterized protein KY384_002154 [Bacidia gigantensis]KAG8533371.1 hypothetical protein KY384_002154 [Bacidia gigantensis]
MASRGFRDFDEVDPFSNDISNQGTLNESGLKCELKTFESRFNSKGEKVVLSVGSRKHLEIPEDRAHDSALVLTRFYNKDKELDGTTLEIRSPYIKRAFKEVAPEYKELNVQAKHIFLVNDARYLFYYRKELQEYGRKLNDQTAIEHLMFALTYMYRKLERELHTYYNFVEAPSSLPSIDFVSLWMVFRPGSYMYLKVAETERVLKIVEINKRERAFDKPRWVVKGQLITYNGLNFGYITENQTIRSYDGYKPLTDLPVKPLDFLVDRELITQRMVERGKKYTSLHGTHHCEYDGTAEALAPERRITFEGEEDEFPLQTTTVRGRIMIDGKRFYESAPSHEPYYEGKTISVENEEHLNLGNDDYLICSFFIPGFALVDKRWCFFNVDLVKDAEYNLAAFESLMLDKSYKQMIFSLVNVHTILGLSFDDVIKGKGKGLIFLLHGVPGVGKSLTAESVADFCKRPLYTITAGDIGASSHTVELGLGKALRLAESWNAIVLIDEADVFLEQRQTSDLTRNGLVSVFLRIIEYYQGIMFLTTNRIVSFDEAFKSRIHLAINYPALSPAFRKSLWKTFLRKVSPDSKLDWLSPANLEQLAHENLNGRQIKNTARTAYALAVGEQSPIKLQHIETALKAIQAFESDLAGDIMQD